jgi:hypothetical protein
MVVRKEEGIECYRSFTRNKKVWKNDDKVLTNGLVG